MPENPLLTERQIIRVMRDLYRKRLVEMIQEADLLDDDGNVIVARDLKVRHKDSQYEYTVDDVLEDPETGEIMIALRLPEDPRFDPPPGEDVLIKDRKKVSILDEDELVDLNSSKDLAFTEDPADEIFFIDQEEFEKEYEVK